MSTYWYVEGGTDDLRPFCLIPFRLTKSANVPFRLNFWTLTVHQSGSY